MNRETLPPGLPVVWNEDARTHLKAISAYIRRDSPQNAINMVERLLGATQSLGRFPQLYRVSQRVEGAREIPVPPYLILYEVSRTAVTILAVVHGRQKFPRSDS